MKLSVGLAFAFASGLLLVTAAHNEEINFPVQLIEANHGFVGTVPLTRQVIPHRTTNPRFFRKKLAKLLKKKLLLLKFKKLLPLKLLFLRSNDGVGGDSRKPALPNPYLESISRPNFQLYNEGGNLPSYEVPGELLHDEVLNDVDDDNDNDEMYENYEASDRPQYGSINKGITTTTTEVGPPPPPLVIFAMPPSMEFGRAYAYLGRKDRRKFKQ